MKKKTYSSPFAEVNEIRFEGIMAGTVTDIDGNSGSGYGGEGNGEGRVKDFDPWKEGIWVEEEFVEEETLEITKSLW